MTQLSYERREQMADAAAEREGSKTVEPEHYTTADDVVRFLPTCKECRFFEEYGNGYSGICRRHAPSRHSSPSYSPSAMWPETRYGDWCGDYEEFDASALLAAHLKA